jgi:uroporphyrinogen-III synthase
MYRTVSNDFTPEEEFDYDMLLFFSPQGIAALKKNFPDFEQGEIVIGCLGPTTAAAAREANLRIDIEVPSPKYTSMTVAVDDFIKENHKRR